MDAELLAALTEMKDAILDIQAQVRDASTNADTTYKRSVELAQTAEKANSWVEDVYIDLELSGARGSDLNVVRTVRTLSRKVERQADNFMLSKAAEARRRER